MFQRNCYATLSTCSLNQLAMDFKANADRIRKSIVKSKSKGARYRLGPELEISGYGCEDHFLELDTFNHSLEILADFLQDSELTYDIVCDIGLPLLHKGLSYNCRVFCLDGKILGIRPKKFLAGDGNYREQRWFQDWGSGKDASHIFIDTYFLPEILREATNQKSVPFGDIRFKFSDGITLSPESCEELFTPASPHIELSLKGVDIFANGSGSHHNLRKLHQRVDLMCNGMRKCGGVYMYANQLGCDGGRMNYDGCALIVQNGDILSQGEQFTLKEVDVNVATVDLSEVHRYRLGIKARNVLSNAKVCEDENSAIVQVEFSLSGNKVVSSGIQPAKYYKFEEEIAYGASVWCWDYLRRSGANGFFLPLSGGADSSSTAAIIGCMCQMVVKFISDANVDEDEKLRVRKAISTITKGEIKNFDNLTAQELANWVMHTGYLGTSNSSETTKNLAHSLAEQIGAYHLTLDINPMIDALMVVFASISGGLIPKYAVHGGTREENLALQNIQARLRMVLSYLLAQLLLWVRKKKSGAGWLLVLVLGSANVDEGLRGYLTKYDCSSADLNPIGGICKTDLRQFLMWGSLADTLSFPALYAVTTATPSAELIPMVGNEIQSDEVEMGMSYAELTYYGKLRKIYKCGPVSMFQALYHESKMQCPNTKHPNQNPWIGLSARTIAEKVKRFFRFYSINRHKMTVITPSVHMENYSPDDNRHDLRQFIYNTSWPHQFEKMDQLVNLIESREKIMNGTNNL
eukprot:maker-scaffold_7-snap-gene-17.31-mRNA-1 protein AED:0.02 eAED:0.03 QI:0/0.5/0.4/1/1/1/5/515/747